MRPRAERAGAAGGRVSGRRLFAVLAAGSLLAVQQPARQSPSKTAHHRQGNVASTAFTPIPGEPVVALPGASCSEVEQPPFFAVGQTAQRSCAQEFNAAIHSLTFAVDGGPAVDVTDDAFAVSPPHQTVVIPADNAAGSPPAPPRSPPPAGRRTPTAAPGSPTVLGERGDVNDVHDELGTGIELVGDDRVVGDVL
jgi:hypothetical protein